MILWRPHISNRIVFQYLTLRYGANTSVKAHRRDFVYSFRAVAAGFHWFYFFVSGDYLASR